MILEFDDQPRPGFSSVCTTLACARGQAPHKARLDSAMNVPLVAVVISAQPDVRTQAVGMPIRRPPRLTPTARRLFVPLSSLTLPVVFSSGYWRHSESD